MRYKFIFLLIVFVVFCFSSCDFINRYRFYQRFRDKVSENDSIYKAEKKQLPYFPEQFNQTSRLYYIAKIWGFLKYYHENTGKEIVNIDSILIEAINQNEKCMSQTAYQQILSNMIASVQTTPLTANSPYTDINDYMLINNEWMNDTVCLSADISHRLNEIFLRHIGKGNPFIEISDIGRIRVNERSYKEDFPDETIRLLGLFRYWNIINYFFVYKNFMDENWDKVLYESIPRFQNIQSLKEYHWEIARLTNKLEDGHANMPSLEDSIIISQNAPNFNIIKIKDTFLIQEIMIPQKNTEGFQVGDILLEIDNTKTNILYDSLKNFTGSGSYWAQQRCIGYFMLSNHRQTMQIKLLRNKDTLTLTANNIPLEEISRLWTELDRKENLYQWINDTVALLDVRYLTSKNFDRNYKPIKDAKTIIVDMRCYPDNSIMEKMTTHFIPPQNSFCIVTYPDIRFPGMVRYHRSKIDMGSDDCFKGNVIVLVNERTGSFSEYLTMALQQNPKTITVGRATAGSDGNIVRMQFPGNVISWHSGVGIYYPDFTPTQRTGIKIDHIVEPDVESISKGIGALDKAKSLAEDM